MGKLMFTHRAGGVAAAVERRRPVVPGLGRREERRRYDGDEQREGSAHPCSEIGTTEHRRRPRRFQHTTGVGC